MMSLTAVVDVTGGEVRGGRPTDSVECYDPFTDTWTEMRPMPEPRAGHAACVAERRLFVSGGTGTLETPTNTFW